MQSRNRQWVYGVAAIFTIGLAVLIVLINQVEPRWKMRQERAIKYEELKADVIASKENLMFLARQAMTPDEIDDWDRAVAHQVVVDLVILPGETQRPYDGPNEFVRNKMAIRAVLAPNAVFKWDRELRGWRVTASDK